MAVPWTAVAAVACQLLLQHSVSVCADMPRAPPCVAKELRVNCPPTKAHPQGGRAGCASRGCCFDDTVSSAFDWCSFFNKTQPPAPAPAPPPAPQKTPVVWEAGAVRVHASGGVTFALGLALSVDETAPTACTATYHGYLNVTTGTTANGTDTQLGAFTQYTQVVTAPQPLAGTLLSTRFYSALAGPAAFEFTARLPSGVAVQPGANCAGDPIIGFPFGKAARVHVDMPGSAAWLTWRGEMTRHVYAPSVEVNTGPGTAPLVLIGQGGATALVAPANEFLTTGVELASAGLAVGPLSTLAGLPQGYSYTVSMALSTDAGVTATVMAWGHSLQQKYGTGVWQQGTSGLHRAGTTSARNGNTSASSTLTGTGSSAAAAPTQLTSNPLNELLSYSTDLGANYDWLAWKNITSEGTPQDVLLNISRHFKDAGLPIGECLVTLAVSCA